MNYPASLERFFIRRNRNVLRNTKVRMTQHRLHSKDWEVRTVSMSRSAEIVRDHHYAKGVPNTRTYLHGLFPKAATFDAQCIGVAWWIPPTKSAALASYPDNWQGVLSLSRLAVVPGMPTNAASFLIGASMRLVDRFRWPCLVTYADTWQGHTGAIYRATNWLYRGLTKPERIYTLNGRMIARKAGPKTRRHDEMLALGAVCLGSFAKHKFTHIV